MPNAAAELTAPDSLVLPSDAVDYTVTGFSVSDAEDDIVTVNLRFVLGYITLASTEGLTFLFGNGFDNLSMDSSTEYGDLEGSANCVWFHPPL